MVWVNQSVHEDDEWLTLSGGWQEEWQVNSSCVSPWFCHLPAVDRVTLVHFTSFQKSHFFQKWEVDQMLSTL